VVILLLTLKLAQQRRGGTLEEAITNLQEATELYLEEFPLTVVGCALLTTFQIPAHA
jgi:hypothetical protein